VKTGDAKPWVYRHRKMTMTARPPKITMKHYFPAPGFCEPGVFNRMAVQPSILFHPSRGFGWMRIRKPATKEKSHVS
jgi:hypothetical protein